MKEDAKISSGNSGANQVNDHFPQTIGNGFANLALGPSSREFSRAVSEWVWQYQMHYFSHTNVLGYNDFSTSGVHLRTNVSTTGNNTQNANITSPNSSVNGNPILANNPPFLAPQQHPFQQPQIPPTTTGHHGRTDSSQQNAEQSAGQEYTVPSLHRRLLAEFIDFLFLFTMKLVVSVFIIEYVGVSDTASFMMKFLVEELDEQATMEDLQQMLFMALLYRFFVCMYETIFVKTTVRFGGATPGKYFMGLRVVTCDRVQNIGGNKVIIQPAGNVSFTQSFLRAFIKNFSMAFFFPVCITVFFNPSFRAAYDVICRTMVVSDPNWPQNLRQHRRR
ncbi:protein FAM8A1-like [Anneissia japonica]|uniref:protein FAM8A1-like n=1 Tax=Anneissia japonica TaxID=1529436 RepID=UPI0014257542|nr:protein FAM8A1-like [Anneissia japonica]